MPTTQPTLTQSMWSLSLPWYEFVLRGLLVYVFLLVLLRLTGKRQVGQLAPFDLILLLVLSNAIQNAMTGGDNSVLGGFITAATLVLLNYGVSNATYRSKWLEGIIEGRPVLLIHDGKVNYRSLSKVQLTHHELMAALRAAGCANPEKVLCATLENTGSITVVQKSNGDKTIGGAKDDALPPG
jgi:uncharacterized membrane protein YcaP (DUF421 family)